MPTRIRGRRRVLDQEMKVRICALVAQGQSLEEAAEAVEASLRTVQREMKRDEDFEHEVKLSLGTNPDPLKLMQSAARAHWRAAAWLLERTNPEQYGKRPARSASPDQLHAALSHVIEAALQAAAPEERTALFHTLEAASEHAFRCVFPDVGPWGRRTSPTPPPTPLLHAEQMKATRYIPDPLVPHEAEIASCSASPAKPPEAVSPVAAPPVTNWPRTHELSPRLRLPLQPATGFAMPSNARIAAPTAAKEFCREKHVPRQNTAALSTDTDGVSRRRPGAACPDQPASPRPTPPHSAAAIPQ